MGGFEFDLNFDFDVINISFGLNPNLGEEHIGINQEVISQSRNSAGGASVRVPIHDSDLFINPRAFIDNENFNLFFPISDDNNLFMP